MKYEIDIDLGKLADEWEPVAFRKPVKGDNWITRNGDPSGQLQGEPCADGPRLIVRRRWQLPEWFTAEWYCESHNGRQFIAEVEPELNDKYWYAEGTLKDITGITALPKIGGDWRQSKRRNPRSK